jgi:hypothetical protein
MWFDSGEQVEHEVRVVAGSVSAGADIVTSRSRVAADPPAAHRSRSR